MRRNLTWLATFFFVMWMLQIVSSVYWHGSSDGWRQQAEQWRRLSDDWQKQANKSLQLADSLTEKVRKLQAQCGRKEVAD